MGKPTDCIEWTLAKNIKGEVKMFATEWRYKLYGMMKWTVHYTLPWYVYVAAIILLCLHSALNQGNFNAI